MKTTQQMTGDLLWTSVIGLERRPMGKLEKGIFFFIVQHFSITQYINMHIKRFFSYVM